MNNARPFAEPIADPTGKPLLANTLYAISGNGFFYLCQLAVVVLLAKFTTPQIQGQYFLGLAVATPVVLLCGLELRGAFVADAAGQFTFGTYYALRRTMLAPAALLLAAFLVFKAMVEPRFALVVIVGGVFVTRMIWSLGEVGWGTFQRRERLDLLAASASLRGLALLLPFALLLPLWSARAAANAADPNAPLATGSAIATLLAALGAAACFFGFERPLMRDPQHWDLSWTRPALRALAWQTLPLGAVALIVNLCDSFPRVFLERVPNGASALGYFGSLASITLAGNLIVLQAATAAANRLAHFYQCDLSGFLRLGAGLLGLAGGIGGVLLLVAFLFGRWLLGTLFTPEYADYEAEFRIIVYAQCLALLTNIFGTATTQMRLFWLQVPAQVLTLAATVAAAITLIPRDPVHGAALTALARAAVQLALYTACVAIGLGYRSRILRRPRFAAAAHPPGKTREQ